MSTFIRRFLVILAAASVCALSLGGTAFAQDPPKEEPPAAPAEEPKAEESKLTEEQLDYVAISGTVACYNKRVAEADKASKAIEAFLEAEGLTLDEYQGMEKNFRGDNAVQEAIKEEMALCDTKVLAMPEEEAAEEALTDEEKKELEDAEKKFEWTYAKKVYKASAGGGISKGRVVFAFQKNGKNAKGNVTGKYEGQSFAIGLTGVRNKNAITLKGTSGKKNSGTMTVTFKKKTVKNYKDSGQDVEVYSTADGSFKGKINGKDVKFSFTAESKK